jgi:adenylate cyclase
MTEMSEGIDVAEGSGETKSTSAHSGALDAFLSYASQDIDIAEAACEALEHAGVTCWIAPRDVAPGTFYADEIVHAIDASKALVLILSVNAASSPHILREVERAASKRHPVVSLRIDKTSLPAGLQYFLNTSQWLDASGVEPTRTFPKLITAVRAAIQAPNAIPLADPTPSSSAPIGPGRSSKRRAIIAASVIGLGIAAFVADRLWLSSRRADPTPTPTVVGHTRAEPPATAAIPDKSVAVLPFVDMSQKKDQEYFSDGMSEELIDMLTKVPELRVPARTSSFYFKGKQTTIAEIAKTLSVAYVLEGSVRKSGNALRVTAQLIKADSGYHVWSDSYDRALDDVFKVQDEIANAVVDALKITLANPPTGSALGRTSNTEAYEQYLIGRQFLARAGVDNYHRAEESFRKAVLLDPSFAAAYVGLSDAQYLFDSVQGRLAPAEFQRILALVDRAIELAPKLSDGYSERGMDQLAYVGDLGAAQADLSRALELDPKNSVNQRRFGILQRCLGKVESAVASGKKATDIDPLDAFAWLHLGEAYAASHRFSDAADAMAKAVQISPEWPSAIATFFDVKLQQGRADEVLSSLAWLRDPVNSLPYRAMAEFALGSDIESRKALNEYIALVDKQDFDYDGWKNVATIYAWRGEKQKALNWLERAASQENGGIACIGSDPFFAELHEDPRFKALLRRLKQPP